MKIPCDPYNRFVFTRMEPPVTGPVMQQRPPGSWYFLGDIAPYIVCPECGHAGRLGNHVISFDGTVNPSIDCAEDECQAHYYGMLGGWKLVRPTNL